MVLMQRANRLNQFRGFFSSAVAQELKTYQHVFVPNHNNRGMVEVYRRSTAAQDKSIVKSQMWKMKVEQRRYYSALPTAESEAHSGYAKMKKAIQNLKEKNTEEMSFTETKLEKYIKEKLRDYDPDLKMNNGIQLFNSKIEKMLYLNRIFYSYRTQIASICTEKMSKLKSSCFNHYIAETALVYSEKTSKLERSLNSYHVAVVEIISASMEKIRRFNSYIAEIVYAFMEKMLNVQSSFNSDLAEISLAYMEKMLKLNRSFNSSVTEIYSAYMEKMSGLKRSSSSYFTEIASAYMGKMSKLKRSFNFSLAKMASAYIEKISKTTRSFNSRVVEISSAYMEKKLKLKRKLKSYVIHWGVIIVCIFSSYLILIKSSCSALVNYIWDL